MEALEIPPEISSGCPYLQLYGTHQMKLENYTRILHYDSKRLLLQCKSCQMELLGHNLLILQYSGSQLTVTGCIEKISFL